MRLVVLTFLLAVVPNAESEPLADFSRAFKLTRDPFSQLASRQASFQAIKATEGAAVEKALLAAIGNLEVELRRIEEARSPILVAAGKKGKFRDLRSRRHLDPQRKLARQLQSHLLSLSSIAEPRVLARSAISNDRLPFAFRLALLERHGGSLRRQTILKQIRHKKFVPRILGLHAMSKGRADILSLAIGALQARSMRLRQHAASALARIQLPQCVSPLITALKDSDQAASQSVADALADLTGMNLGTSVVAWERWYKDNAANPLAGRKSRLRVTKKKRKKNGESKTQSSSSGYYGLPIGPGSVCFVLDNSQSMRVKLKGEYEGDGPSRMARAKTELIRILRQLKPGTRFNIIAFAREAVAFSETMETVKGDRVEEAIQWVEGLPLKLGTALYDGLDLAFRQAGRPVGNENYRSSVDTYYVLTDGMPYRVNPDPTKTGIKGDDKAEILMAVSEWNLFDQAVIHVVGMGKQIPHKFLGKLAAENGGRYVRVE